MDLLTLPQQPRFLSIRTLNDGATSAPALMPLTQTRPGHSSPALTLARRCCPLLMRPLYRWGKATVEAINDPWQEALGLAPNQRLTLTVPMWLPVRAPFVFKGVLDAQSGEWCFAYAYTDQLRELSKREAAAAQTLLTRLDLPGLVRPWWK